jgi:uncharacterized damage-inducible protein DinB
MPTELTRPAPDEYAPYYESYFRQVTEPDVLPLLEQQLRETANLLRSFSDEVASRSNELGKWSVKEIIGHLVDCERIFTYRALRFARNDSTPLPGFEHHPYMEAAGFNQRPLADLIDEYEHVRQATIDLFRSLSAEACLRRGIADGKSISVRALAWNIAAHERHHLKILKQRYL